MKRFILVKLLLSATLAVTATGSFPNLASAAHAAPGALVMVPADTVVTLVPAAEVATHNVGDSIDFGVKEPVIVDGWVVIPKGARTISDLTIPGVRGLFNPFGGTYSQPSLHLAFDWVQLDTGKLRLDSTPVELKGRQIKRSAKGLFGPNTWRDRRSHRKRRRY